MNWVSGAVTIGMMGIFLPFTIYLQSALGFSALKAGLTMAPASLVSMFVAPVAGRMTDRIGGKYILFAGLAFFAAGMGWTMGIASTTSTWQDFVPGLAVAGFGMGCTFAPMTTVAMRSVQPMMAGAAALPAEARLRAATLPAQARGSFVTGFAKAAQRGIQVGAGQGNIKLPAGTPPSLITQIEQLGREVFSLGFVNAMHQTMILPITVLSVAALSCLAIRQVTVPASPAPGEAIQQPEASQAPA